MKRTNFFRAIVVIMVAFLFLTGCSSTPLSVDENIINKSKMYAENFSVLKTETIIIERKKDRFILIHNGDTTQPAEIYIPDDFEEEKPFSTPPFSKKLEVPKRLKSLLNSAKKCVIAYIDSSTVIRAEDKEKCKNFVNEVKLHNRIFSDSYYSDIGMVTLGNNIYINNNWVDYINERMIIHELVHVISNKTNEGTKFEFHSYRSSMVNEVITELIAREISEQYNLPTNTNIKIKYDLYFEPTLDIIAKLDLLDCYYYSDKYDGAINQIGKDMLDLIFITINNLDENNQFYWAILFYELNEIMK